METVTGNRGSGIKPDWSLIRELELSLWEDVGAAAVGRRAISRRDIGEASVSCRGRQSEVLVTLKTVFPTETCGDETPLR